MMRSEYSFFDIETMDVNGIQIPYCICFINEKEKLIFYGYDCVKKFIKYIFKKKEKTIIYAHNLDFDGSFILEECSKNKIKTKGLYFRNSIYKIELKNCIFKCSFKIFPISLKRIGEMIGDEKFYKINIDILKINSENFNNNEIKESVVKYCMRDVEIVKEFINLILLELSIFDKKIFYNCLSVSSLALKIFENSFNKININCKLKIEYDNIIRQAYYGGRCEVFGNSVKGEYVYHYDFTGMYSEIMKGNFIFGNITIINNVTDTKEPGFYIVEIESDIKNIPILPYRSKDDILLFPNGKWISMYWWEEINYFLKLGGKVLKVLKYIKLEKNGVPFESFINNFSKLRNKDKFNKIFWKLFVNSLSGRLGMGISYEKTEIFTTEKEYKNLRMRLLKENKEILKEKIIGKIMIITYEDNSSENELVNSNVCITAAITSKARIKLHKAYIDVSKKNGRVLYSDTDSIFAAFKRKVDNENHGEIFWDTSKKDTVIDESVFAIPKGYAIKNKYKTIVRLKGHKTNSITFEEFKKAFKTGTIITKKEINFVKKNIIPAIKEIEKQTTLNNYKKRIFNKQKTKTKPIWVIN